MDHSLVPLMVASFVVSAGLLWLAGEIAVAAFFRPAPIGRALFVVVLLLTACALWWPTQAMRAGDAHSSLRGVAMLVPGLLALFLAATSFAVGSLWSRGQRLSAAAAAVAMPIVAYGQIFGVAAALQFGQAPGWTAAGALTLSLSAALLATQLRFGGPRHARYLRAGAAAFAAALGCLGAAMALPATAVLRWSPGPEWLVMPGLIAISVVLLTVLNHGREPAPGSRGRPWRASAVDSLTGLPTRLYFEGRLHRAASTCNERSTRLAVLFIDLDGFKPVNDTFGHSSGDRVLEQVGRRLRALARGTGVAARIGGDEFLLLAVGPDSRDEVAQLAQRVIDALSRPYRVDGREVSISCSVGIALYPAKCQPDKLIARADAAMYAAKRTGGSRHCFYAPEMDADVQQNFDMLRDLRRALANHELELYFQPKIDARSGKVTAAEALLRWNHPTRGMLMPGHFLPLAERSGLIGPIGNWVIEAACTQARAWRDKGLRMRVAINLSAHQMRQDDIADRITDALARHRIHPSLLTCEITESAAMEDTSATQETFRRLGELGAHLSIDDFGTGYSSLGYLRQLPAEELKIDSSFVKDLDHSADARAVIDAVVKLAHALGLKVVAEGVETLRQQKILIELGCDELQGFLFAKPMTAQTLLQWAMADRSASAVFRGSLFGETRQAAVETSLRGSR